MILLFLRVQLKIRVHLISQNFPLSPFPFRKLLSKHLDLQKLSSVDGVEKIPHQSISNFMAKFLRDHVITSE